MLTSDDIPVEPLPLLRALTDLPAGRGYFIFGAARGGELLLTAARRFGCSPLGFIDLSRKGELAGLPILHPDLFVQTWPADMLVVFSNAYAEQNAELLRRHGFTNFINAHALVMAFAQGEDRVDAAAGRGGPVRLIRLNYPQPDGDRGWIAVLPRSNAQKIGEACGLRLFEDGVELGPAHSLHWDVREKGEGRYCWQQGQLWFSTSDNSDPRTNGRDYFALLSEPGPMGSLLSLAENAAVLPDDAPETVRHQMMRQIAKIVYPGFTLPDLGRRIDHDMAFHAVMRRFFPEGNVADDRRYALGEFAKIAAGLEGDLAECGCFTGASAYVVADVLRRSGVVKTMHLFDSFSGLAAPSACDGGHWRAGDLACDLATVRGNLAEFPFIQFHPGWIPESFAAVQGRRFSLVHIDVDLYQATLDSLCFFWDRIVPQGLLICDDYGFTTCPGATRALDDFFKDRPEPILNLPSGGALIIKKG